MVRERTPARNRPKSQLGESWVVESDGDDEYTPPTKQTNAMRCSRATAEPAESPRKRPSRVNVNTSAEPAFIMPSMHESGVDGSWLGEEKPKVNSASSNATRRAQRPEDRDTSTFHRPEHRGKQEKLVRTSKDFANFMTPMFSWSYDVLGGALQALKTPISYLIAGWLLVGLLVFLRNLLFSSIYSALSPVCTYFRNLYSLF